MRGLSLAFSGEIDGRLENRILAGDHTSWVDVDECKLDRLVAAGETAWRRPLER